MIAATDNQSLTIVLGTLAIQASCSFQLTGLTAGSNTFTAKYRENALGTATFLRREIWVRGI